jgi:hypothetical protein
MKWTLDEVWCETLCMWQRIVNRYHENNTLSVPRLKREWLRDHGYSAVRNGCLFCEYAGTAPPEPTGQDISICRNCPGRLVDPTFSCFTLRRHGDWYRDPVGFYERLCRLYLQRQKQKG